MPRTFTPKVLTANDLLSGDVVYLAANSRLTRVFSDALLIENETEAEGLMNWAEGQAGTFVGPYLADATQGRDGQPRPVHIREQLRSMGPSNYPHGKQAGE